MHRVARALLRIHRHKHRAVRPVRQLLLDICLAPAQQKRPDAFTQALQVFVSFRPAVRVEHVKIAVKAEERAQHLRIQHGHQRIDVINAVLQRRAGQHKHIAALELFHGLRGLGVPVLDALRLVQDHAVWLQHRIDQRSVAHDLLVVGQREKGRPLIRRLACGAVTKHGQEGEIGKEPDLLFPLGFQRGRRNHEHTLDMPQPMEQRGRGHGLRGFAETHLVSQHRALSESEMQHALTLIRQQRQLGLLRRIAAVADLLLIIAPPPDPFLVALALGTPGGDLLGDSQGGTACLLKGGQDFLLAVVRQGQAGDIEKPPKCRRQQVHVALHHQTPGGRVRHKVDTRRPPLLGQPQRERLVTQPPQHPFDMLAGAEPVDTEIDTCAGADQRCQAAQLHLIGLSARRRHAKI